MAIVGSRVMEVVIRAKDLYTKTMTKAQQRTIAFSKSVGRAKNSVISLRGAIIGLGAAAVFKSLLRIVEDFQEALFDLPKVTSEALDVISDKILGMNSILGRSTDLVKGYYQVISAGVTNPAKAMKLLTVAARAGKAAHVDLSDTVKALTKLMEGMGDEFKNAEEAADLLFATERFGQTTFAELVPEIGDVAKQSKMLNITAKEMAGTLAQVTLATGSVSTAATQYRAVLTGLTKATPALAAHIRKLGFANSETAIKSLGFIEVLKSIQKETGGSSTALNALLGRKEAILGFAGIAKDNFKAVEERIIGVGNAAGSAAKAFTIWAETSKADTDEIKADIDKFAIDMEDSLLVVKRAALSVAKELLNVFTMIGKGLGMAAAELAGADLRTEIEKITDELKFLDSFESFALFETAGQHAAEVERLRARLTALNKEETVARQTHAANFVKNRAIERVAAEEAGKARERALILEAKVDAELAAQVSKRKEEVRITKELAVLKAAEFAKIAPGVIGGADSEFGQEAVQMQTRFDALVEFHNRRIQFLQDIGAAEIDIRNAVNQAQTDLDEQAQHKSVSIAQARAGAIASIAESLNSILGGKSKVAFRIMQAMAIREAIINGKTAAIAAWRAGMSTGGPTAPLVAALFAGASLAKTGAMIAQIGGSQGGDTGGGIPRPADISPTGSSFLQPTAQPASQINITINTSTGDIPQDTIDKLIKGIDDAALRNVFINDVALEGA